uniref:Uncharacterized protein n=1 Tax=Avena sativa TaxID=4498 RepID=A0ACD6A7I9_AVESA
MMIIWRIWYVRNEITHDKSMPPIEGSRRFLCSYLKSLQNEQKHSVEEITKGKMPLCAQPSAELRGLCVTAGVASSWTRPTDGFVKLNTDGSFMQKDGTAGAGMILRRHDGSIILTSCMSLRKCGSALEAELQAFMEGTALAMEWCQEQILIETDSSLLVSMLKNREHDRSPLGHLIMEARELLSNRIAGIAKVPRSQNISSDLLAKFGRLNDRTAVWLGSGPEDILDSLVRDCNTALIA